MATRKFPDLDFILQALREENGRLFWLIRPEHHFASSHVCNAWNTRWAGKEAGNISTCRNNPRHVIQFNGKHVYRYFIVWAMHHGDWPTFDLDHENRDSLDDRIDNLRPATRSQNNANSRISSRNTSGVKGVSWSKVSNKWLASIKVNGKYIYLGLFDDLREARAVRKKAARELHGEFRCDGKS